VSELLSRVAVVLCVLLDGPETRQWEQREAVSCCCCRVIPRPMRSVARVAACVDDSVIVSKQAVRTKLLVPRSKQLQVDEWAKHETDSLNLGTGRSIPRRHLMVCCIVVQTWELSDIPVLVLTGSWGPSSAPARPSAACTVHSCPSPRLMADKAARVAPSENPMAAGHRRVEAGRRDRETGLAATGAALGGVRGPLRRVAYRGGKRDTNQKGHNKPVPHAAASRRQTSIESETHYLPSRGDGTGSGAVRVVVCRKRCSRKSRCAGASGCDLHTIACGRGKLVVAGACNSARQPASTSPTSSTAAAMDATRHPLYLPLANAELPTTRNRRATPPSPARRRAFCCHVMHAWRRGGEPATAAEIQPKPNRRKRQL
jgi:hypothetical protein